MIYYGQYLCSIIVESLNYGYALKGGFFMEVRPRYALWKYDDEALYILIQYVLHYVL